MAVPCILRAWSGGGGGNGTGRGVGGDVETLIAAQNPSFSSISPIDRNTRAIKRMARKAWESWGSWFDDVGRTLGQAASSSLGRLGPSGARTVWGGVAATRRSWGTRVIMTGGRGHSDHGVNGRLRHVRLSRYVNLSLPLRVPSSSDCPPQYRSVSQGNWLVNSVKPFSHFGAP